MAYRAGELDQRVTIRRDTLTSDGVGGQTKATADIATVWALVRPKSGRERAAYASIEASATYHCVLREPIDVRETDTIRWHGPKGDVDFNIRFAAVRGRSGYVELDLESGVAL